MKKVAIVTLGWRDYTIKYFASFMEAVREQDYIGEIQVFVTDNETSPETAAHIQKTASEAVLILNKNNDGFAKGMNDGIREAMRQGYDYIAVVNIHNFIEPGYISELVKVLEKDKKVGVAQGLMLMPDKKTIMSRGAATHFLGFGYAMGYREKYSKNATSPTPSGNLIFYPSGSSMIFRREVLERVGLMDEEYWMYNEDQESGWRLWLVGYKCVLAPKAVVVSDYQFKRSIKKVYWMDRNRILSMLLCYKLPTLLLIFPAFVAMEIGQIVFSVMNGWFLDKLRVYYYFLKPFSWVYILRARKRNQKLRITKDKEIVGIITGMIKHQEFDEWKLRAANIFFGLYWKIVKLLIFW